MAGFVLWKREISLLRNEYRLAHLGRDLAGRIRLGDLVLSREVVIANFLISFPTSGLVVYPADIFRDVTKMLVLLGLPYMPSQNSGKSPTTSGFVM